MEAIWSALVTPPPPADVFTPLLALYVVVLAAGFVVCAYVTGPGEVKSRLDATAMSQLERHAAIGIWVFGFGLLLAGIRLLRINPLALGAPVWLGLSAILVLAYLAVTTRWLRQQRASIVDDH